MAGSSRNYGNPDDKIRNSDELSKAAALRELEKARVRECQMEKTVRWWTVCTAGWRKKWSKLRQENEELRKQIKGYKSQLSGITQDCATLNNKLEYFDAHNAYLKCELNKLLLKYGDEGNDHIQEILNVPDIIKPKVSTCVECQERQNEPKTSDNALSTPDVENPLLSDTELKFPLMEDGCNEVKKMEVLTEMISKIFGELQSLQAEYAQNNEGIDMKDLSEFPINREQLYHLQLYSLTKKLELERKEKKELFIKLEMANTNISILSEKVEEIASGDFILDTDLKIPIESLSLSDEE